VRELGGRIDAAIVATPNATHVPVAIELLEQSVHVLCEKPFATSVDAARELLDTAQRTRTRVMPAHVRRFEPSLAAAHRLVQDGAIGRPISFRAQHSSLRGVWASRTAYRGQRSLSGGGVLIELGVHLVDLAIWFLGREIVDVEGTVECDGEWEVEADARLTIGFASGAVASVAASDRRVLDTGLVLRGSDGWLEVGQDDAAPVTVFSRGARACRVDGLQRVVPGAGDPFEAQLDAFCHCVRTGAPWPVPDDEVLLGLEVITGVYARQPPALEAAR